jgi:outer membrane protein OmpA-like peptidoglycan-associated protein
MATAAPSTSVSQGPPPPPPVTDPYVTTRANLRDTIKWLAATFSALAAVVVAGAPLSGLAKLPFGLQWAAAVVVLAVAFACICMALAITISLLRGDFLYLSDIVKYAAAQPPQARPTFKERIGQWRHVLFYGQDIADFDSADRKVIPLLCKNLADHPGDILPFDFPTVPDFANEMDRRKAAFEQAKAQWESNKDEPSKEAHTLARANWNELEPTLQKVIFFGSTFLFYARTRLAMRKLFLLGAAALVLLVVFGTLAQEPEKAKDSKPSNSVVNNFAPTPVSPTPPTTPPPTPPAQAFPSLQPVLFKTGMALLDGENLKRVDAARNALHAYPRASLLLFAHTDTIAGDKVNEGLAHRRGAAVRRALIREGGLDAARILVSEQPKSGLPQLTGAQTASQTNRSVVMQLVDLP